MKENKYTSPEVDIIDIRMETGFATSGEFKTKDYEDGGSMPGWDF